MTSDVWPGLKTRPYLLQTPAPRRSSLRPGAEPADNPGRMICPKCGFTNSSDATECARCRIVMARYRSSIGDAPSAQSALEAEADVAAAERRGQAERAERRARATALPAALASAWLAVSIAPAAVRMIAMWVHETGHAAAAWLCGYLAWPGPWFTPVSESRSLALTVLMASGLIAGAVQAWRAGRTFWAAMSAVVCAVTVLCTFVLRPGQAQQLIVFGGDGGCLVLGTALMLTVYAREDSPVRRERLRWGLLVIGALAFMDVYAVWSGPLDRLPFGENENGLSDPSVLTEMWGWSVPLLVNRYMQLAHACVGLLGLVYAADVTGFSVTAVPDQ